MKSEKAKIAMQVFWKSNKKLKTVLTVLERLLRSQGMILLTRHQAKKYLSIADKGRGLEIGEA